MNNFFVWGEGGCLGCIGSFKVWVALPIQSANLFSVQLRAKLNKWALMNKTNC